MPPGNSATGSSAALIPLGSTLQHLAQHALQQVAQARHPVMSVWSAAAEPPLSNAPEARFAPESSHMPLRSNPRLGKIRAQES
jgi:hypothetical protein